MVLVRGFIGSAVDGVIGSDTIITIAVGVSIGGVPSQGKATKGNFKSAVPRINGSCSRSSFFL